MFAVLHIAHFALQAVLRQEPALAGRPAALFSGTGKKSLVLLANGPAQQAGVIVGMTAPHAVARCPALIIRAAQPEAEAEARATLFATGFSLSPAIEDTAPGVCTIDLKGTTPARHEQIAQQAVRQLEQLGLIATAGVGRTPLLALYAARATDFVRVITDEDAFLAPLPVTLADPTPRLLGILTSWGVRTLGELSDLPRDQIVQRFGAEGLALCNRAIGGSTRPLKPVALPQVFEAGMEFEEEITTLEPLLFLLRRFIDRLALELRAAQFIAAEVHLRLKFENDTSELFDLRLPEPTSDEEIVFRALHTRLESLRTEAAICAMQIRITPTRPLVRQQGLFDTGLRDPHGFAETLARIATIVGAESVGAPQRHDTHRPDAVRLHNIAPVLEPTQAPPVHSTLGLPLRRFRPPLAVKLELVDQRPTYVWTEYFEGEITRATDPWFSDGGWWQKNLHWGRQEWDIGILGGGLYRLSRVGGIYFIEGEYD